MTLKQGSSKAVKVLLKAIATNSVEDVDILLVLLRGSKGVTEVSKEIPRLSTIFYNVPTITSFWSRNL